MSTPPPDSVRGSPLRGNMSHRSALGRGSPLGSVPALPLWTRWPRARHFTSVPRSRLNRDIGGIELMYRELLEQL